MNEHLRNNLQILALEQYIDVMQANGFTNWDTLSKAQEHDLDHLGLKLGHRRRLQRELASMRGFPIWASLDEQNGEYTPPGQLLRQQPSAFYIDTDVDKSQGNPIQIHNQSPRTNESAAVPLARGRKRIRSSAQSVSEQQFK
jgi:hypothetical protein